MEQLTQLMQLAQSMSLNHLLHGSSEMSVWVFGVYPHLHAFLTKIITSQFRVSDSRLTQNKIFLLHDRLGASRGEEEPLGVDPGKEGGGRLGGVFIGERCTCFEWMLVTEGTGDRRSEGRG